MDIAARCPQPELMDQPDLAPIEHRQALAGLRRINLFSRTVPAVWGRLETIAQRRRLHRLRVLDVASGGGDFALGLAQRAAERGYDVHVTGCDISPLAVAVAEDRRRQLAISGARFVVSDVLNDTLSDEYDIVTCTLFMHHLTRTQAVALLRRAASIARHAVLVDDLLRSRTGYLLAQVGC
ncbi:MAG: methyltransferase domain-containing protein, partial [Planctomycetales bacterium]|nr:methyltransferase domain-containing protein [Planctomycetales bacterium]